MFGSSASLSCPACTSHEQPEWLSWLIVFFRLDDFSVCLAVNRGWRSCRTEAARSILARLCTLTFCPEQDAWERVRFLQSHMETSVTTTLVEATCFDSEPVFALLDCREEFDGHTDVVRTRTLVFFFDTSNTSDKLRVGQATQASFGPPARYCHSTCSIRLHDLWQFVFGGSAWESRPDQQTMLADSWVYNCRLNDWHKLRDVGQLPPPRDDAALCPLTDDTVLLHGGFDGCQRLGDAWVGLIDWDNLSVSWTVVCDNGPKPCHRRRHALVAISHDVVILHGGETDGDQNLLSDTWELRLDSFRRGSWSLISSQGPLRQGHILICINSSVVLVGHNDADVFRLTSWRVRAWHRIARLPNRLLLPTLKGRGGRSSKSQSMAFTMFAGALGHQGVGIVRDFAGTVVVHSLALADNVIKMPC